MSDRWLRHLWPRSEELGRYLDSKWKFHSRCSSLTWTPSLAPFQGHPDEHNRRLSPQSEERRRRIVVARVYWGGDSPTTPQRTPSPDQVPTPPPTRRDRVTRGQYLCTLLTGTWIYARPLYYAFCRPPCKPGMPGTVSTLHATNLFSLHQPQSFQMNLFLFFNSSIANLNLFPRTWEKCFSKCRNSSSLSKTNNVALQLSVLSSKEN